MPDVWVLYEVSVTPYVLPITEPSTVCVMVAGFGPRFVEILSLSDGPQLNVPPDALAGCANANTPTIAEPTRNPELRFMVHPLGCAR